MTDTKTSTDAEARGALVSRSASGFDWRLSIAIEREGLLECDLARRSGVDATQINHFTRGRREPSLAL